MNPTAILAWFNPTRWLLLGGLVLALVAAGWRIHHNIWQGGYDAAEAKYAKQAISANTQRAAVAPPIAAKHEAAVVQIRTVTKTILKEVPVYVKATDCPMPGGFRVLHDAAADGRIPEPAGIADAAAVPADVAAGTVAENYGLCHETAERLTALQSWVRAQQALRTSGAP